jgi:hypothetical protein
MNNKEGGTKKERVVTLFEVPSRNLPGESQTSKSLEKYNSSPKRDLRAVKKLEKNNFNKQWTAAGNDIHKDSARI